MPGAYPRERDAQHTRSCARCFAPTGILGSVRTMGGLAKVAVVRYRFGRPFQLTKAFPGRRAHAPPGFLFQTSVVSLASGRCRAPRGEHSSDIWHGGVGAAYEAAGFLRGLPRRRGGMSGAPIMAPWPSLFRNAGAFETTTYGVCPRYSIGSPRRTQL